MLYNFLLVFHCLFSALLIALVLLQPSRGADMMVSGGASQTLFGSQGAASFITKFTGLIAFLFFSTSLSLHYLTIHQQNQNHTLIKAAEMESKK